MVDLSDVFGEMVAKLPAPEPATQQVPVQLSIKQAKNLIKLHDQLAQAYQDIPGCREVAINHRKEARTIDKMMKAHLRGR